MRAARSAPVKTTTKAPTGIAGFDEITRGGLPRGCTTLVLGGPGSGKTVFALHFLVHGTRTCKEPGIFVAFEETSKRIVANIESFGWNLAKLSRNKLFFMDAQPMPDLIQSGTFDLGGMLAALEVQIKHMGARRIVFDALDVVLALLPDADKRREMYRLHQWLSAHHLTGVITAKARISEMNVTGAQATDFMFFMVDCAVVLNHDVVLGISHRNLRVQKYRGSGFDEDESPFLIGSNGLEVAAIARSLNQVDAPATKERVSSGVRRLDTMLGGGFFREGSVLITGSAGTAKTTLAGAFTEAACLRGERAMFVSFDSDCSEVIRNLDSVAIRLERFVKNGLLRTLSARTIAGSAETYLMRIKTLAIEHKTRCLVIDPMSAWSASIDDKSAQNVAKRLIDWSKMAGITLVCTRLLDETTDMAERGSPLQISTLADTWVHVSYLVQAGERNRGLSIVKSRGTAHSNQVRELILSDTGVTLTDTYTAGGEVLMGTLRWEKERDESIANEAAEVASSLQRSMLDTETAELELQMKVLRTALDAKQRQKASLQRAVAGRKNELTQTRTRMRELRSADTVLVKRT